MKKTTNTVEEISKVIIKNASDEILKILEVLDLEFEDLYCLIENLPDNDKDKVINITINKLLKKLKLNFDMDLYNEISMEIERIINYYASKKNEFDAVIKEGNRVATDILFKVVGYKGQQFDLPIDISCIKRYCLSAEIKKEQVYDVLMWIIIRYIAIDKRMAWQEYLEDLKKNRENNKVV